MEILKFNPCEEAVEYRKKHNSFKEAWENCPRGDWMLWIASKLEIDFRKLTLAKARCAKTVIHLMKDERSIRAVEVAESYGNCEASLKELKSAAAYAAAAYAAAAYVAYANAAYAAYAAADSDADAAYAADYAAAATVAEVYATYVYITDVANADADAVEKNNQLETANICKQLLTDLVIEKINKLK